MHLNLVLPLSLVLIIIIINSVTTDTTLRIRFSAKALESDQDSVGKSYEDPDPFVEVWYAGSEFDQYKKTGETAYFDNEVNPIWNEAFEFTLKGKDPPNPSAQVLRPELFDYDSSSANDRYGYVTVRLNTLALCAKYKNCTKDGKSVLCFSVELNPTGADNGQRSDDVLCVPLKRHFSYVPAKLYEFKAFQSSKA